VLRASSSSASNCSTRSAATCTTETNVQLFSSCMSLGAGARQCV
jgi:hypothetical protein